MHGVGMQHPPPHTHTGALRKSFYKDDVSMAKSNST